MKSDSDELYNVLESLLVVDVNTRPSVVELLSRSSSALRTTAESIERVGSSKHLQKLSINSDPKVSKWRDRRGKRQEDAGDHSDRLTEVSHAVQQAAAQFDF
mmetsp:Transcript_3889/g.4954  ORF Transcript_3889/g.4954 Transcript_3889/m.4954 type:complete len:102 (-) Transcript_3889:33-338(-)